MSYTRTNYRVTGAQIDDDAVTSGKISARAVVASSIATAIVAQSHLQASAKFRKGYKANIKSSTSAYIKVSTGLASPLFGLALERASATVANRFKKLRYARATGSYILFRLYRYTWTTSNKFKMTLYLSSATVQFNWLAFEA